MQEEVENRTVNLAITTTQLSWRTVVTGIRMYLNHREKAKMQKAEKGVHGKQSVKDLIGQNQGVSRMPIGDASIRDFEREAHKYGVDFAVTKDKTADPPQYSMIYTALMSDSAVASTDSTPGVTVEIDTYGWEEIFDYLNDVEKACASEMIKEHIPAPDVVGYELEDSRNGAVIAEASMAWSDRKIVLLLPEQEECKELFETEGWKVFLIETIRETNPKEYAAYKRLDARSIVGVPFGQHPLGFMVVRNVKRYAEHYEPLQLACFVAMMMLEQIRRARMESLFKAEEEKEDGKFHIRYNILGPHNMVIKGHEITEQDLKNPNRRAWVIMLYMVLHRLPVDQQKMIEDIWPDEEINTSRNNIRQAIFRMHNDLAVYHDVKVIDTRNRMMSFSDDVKITTDAQEMENLYQEACKMPESRDKLFMLEKAFFLYRGRLFIQGDADVGNWLYTYTSHYNQIFVDITSELLAILGHSKDYRCIMDFGPAALEIEPGIQAAYYWIIIAADNLGNSVAKDQFMKKASEELIEEEYERLQEMLELQKHRPVTENK